MFSKKKHKGKKGKLVSLEDFEILSLVGKGNFGKVYRVKEIKTGKIYAMKVMRKQDIIEQDYVKHVNRERDILAELGSSSFFTGCQLYTKSQICGSNSPDYFSFRTSLLISNRVMCLFSDAICSRRQFI